MWSAIEREGTATEGQTRPNPAEWSLWPMRRRCRVVHDSRMRQPRRPRPAHGDPRPGRAAALLLALLVTAVVGAAQAEATSFVPGPSPIIGRRGPTPVSGSITFYGRGFGHGVGMSQYGARGRAMAGQLAPAILTHYYPNTTLGQHDPTALARVLVLSGYAASGVKPLTITGIGGDWKIDGVAATFPKSARLTLAPTAAGATTWTLTVTSK